MDRIADKIAKLLRLADRAGTPEEAATAFALAQQMMTNHAITEAQIAAAAAAEGCRTEEPIVSRTIWAAKSGQMPSWVSVLAACVCAVNGCAPLIRRDRAAKGPVIVAWGTSADLSRAESLLSSVIGQIDALAKRSGYSGRTALNNFRIGACDTVNARLKAGRAKALSEAAKPDCAITTTALAVVQGAGKRADLAMRSEVSGIRSGGRSYFNRDADARAAGQRAGHSVNTSAAGALR